ncbi:MAG: PD40 domain-containing protein, partial [Anaerolineae bacterium]|nr:PD40 domain-containing protein [Anaerolineae bacterium]
TSVIKPLTSFGGQIGHPAWSPDGSRIAFAATRAGDSDVYLIAPDGSGLLNLSSYPANDAWPSWSPDGQRIAFQSDRDGDLELYAIPVTGGIATRLTTSPGADRQPCFSPDGSRIAFVSSRTGNADVFVIDSGGTNAVQLSNTPYDDGPPAWSPDGTTLAYAGRLQPTVAELFTVRADGTDLRQRTSDGMQVSDPVWSPDGAWIAYASNRGGTFDLYVLSTTGAGWAALIDLPVSDETEPRWVDPDAAPVIAAGGAAGGAVLPPPPSVTPNIPPPPTITPYIPPPTTVAPPTVTPTLIPDLVLVYQMFPATFDLVNVSGRPLDLTGLVFQGNMRTIDSSVWLRGGAISSDLAAFVGDGCLGLWGLGVPVPPLPPGCRWRHAWWESDNVVFWTVRTFNVIYNGVPVAVCQSSVGRCEVSLMNRVAVLPTAQPPVQPPAITSGGDLLLIYNAALPSFDLVNVSGRTLNIAGVGFTGNGRQVDASAWLKGGISSDLGSFAVDGCLGLWGLGVPVQPLPAECRWRHGWWESDNVVFWTSGTFSVTFNGVPVATCDSSAGRCAVDLPG